MCLHVTTFTEIQWSAWHVASLSFAFWNFLGFFFFLWVLESVDVSNISGYGGQTDCSNQLFAKHSV